MLSFSRTLGIVNSLLNRKDETILAIFYASSDQFSMHTSAFIYICGGFFPAVEIMVLIVAAVE